METWLDKGSSRKEEELMRNSDRGFIALLGRIVIRRWYWLVAGQMIVLRVLASQPAHAGGPRYVAHGGDVSNERLSPASTCATINGALDKPGFVC